MWSSWGRENRLVKHTCTYIHVRHIWQLTSTVLMAGYYSEISQSQLPKEHAEDYTLILHLLIP